MGHFIFEEKRIYYKTYGKGHPILLLHGNTASSRMFKPLIRLYSKDFQLICIDFPGHGKSERIKHFETDFWHYNSKVSSALLDHLNLRKATLIGSSGGALSAINMALDNPERINYVIADSFEGEFPLGSYIKTLKSDRERDKKKLSAKLFWKYNHGKDWKKIVDSDTDMNIAFMKSGKSFFHKPISELKVPAIFMGSKKDEFCDHLNEIYTEMQKKNDKIEIHLFDKGGHPAILSNKKEFHRIIKEKIKLKMAGN